MFPQQRAPAGAHCRALRRKTLGFYQRSGGQLAARHLGSVLSASFGYGVTVALIDSGIYPSRRSTGASRRSTTSPAARPRRSAVRRLRSRHACRRPDRRPAGAADVAIPRRRAGRAARRPEGARQNGARPHERRHPRDRVRDRQQEQARHRHHQPVARPPDFRAGRDRPAGAGGREGSKAGIIVVASAGNHGVNENGEIGFAGITSPGNAPSALTVGAADHKATVTRATIAWPSTARTVRRGTTAW